MIHVAGSHENGAEMTRTIYMALANRAYMVTRITHHYSHDVKTGASGISCRSRAGCDIGPAPRRCYRSGNGAASGVLFARIRDGNGSCEDHWAILTRHFPARTYALAFALSGGAEQAAVTAGRQAGRNLAARRPGPRLGPGVTHRGTPLPGCGARLQAEDCSTHSKYNVSERHYPGFADGTAGRQRPASSHRPDPGPV